MVLKKPLAIYVGKQKELASGDTLAVGDVTVSSGTSEAVNANSLKAYAPAAKLLPLGGTTGQVPKKNSATDGDVSWGDAPGSDFYYNRYTSSITNSSNNGYTSLWVVACTSNVLYEVNCMVFFDTAANTTGITFDINRGVSNLTAWGVIKAQITSAAAASESATSFYVTNSTAANPAQIATTSANGTCVVEAKFIVSLPTSANLVIQYRSEVDTSTVTVLPGSFIRMKQLS